MNFSSAFHFNTCVCWLVLYSHIINMLIYTCKYMQNGSQRHNDKGRAKISLTKICTSHFIVTFVCEKELETEHNCNILTPTLMAVSVVSFSFSRAAQPAAQRCRLSPPHLITNGSPNTIGGPEGPFGLVWLSLPHLVSNSLTSCPDRVIYYFNAHSIAHSIFGMSCLIVIQQK